LYISLVEITPSRLVVGAILELGCLQNRTEIHYAIQILLRAKGGVLVFVIY
jgi:hypothetical protein